VSPPRPVNKKEGGKKIHGRGCAKVENEGGIPIVRQCRRKGDVPRPGNQTTGKTSFDCPFRPKCRDGETSEKGNREAPTTTEKNAAN